MSDVISVSTGSGAGAARVLFKSLKFIILSYIISFVLILILALVLVYTDAPETISSPAVNIITLSGAFMSAFLTGRRLSSKGWLFGFAAGVINIVILFALGALFTSQEFFCASKMTFILYGGLSGAVGGIIGVNTVKN